MSGVVEGSPDAHVCNPVQPNSPEVHQPWRDFEGAKGTGEGRYIADNDMHIPYNCTFILRFHFLR